MSDHDWSQLFGKVSIELIDGNEGIAGSRLALFESPSGELVKIIRGCRNEGRFLRYVQESIGKSYTNRQSRQRVPFVYGFISRREVEVVPCEYTPGS